MKIVHLKNVEKNKVNIPLFTGAIIRQSPLANIKESDLAIDYIYFPKGIRNKFHSHSNGQVLVVTNGSGTIATKSNKYKVKVGDIIWIPSGEIHWHGANANSVFAHISITKVFTKINQVEK
ncbi:MAG: cupin domain-containing protein [Patescibacteria group bacterium]